MIALLLLVALALLGAPLFSLIAASALLGFSREEIDLSVVAIEVYRVVDMPALIAIPLFTFAGYVLAESGTPHRLVKLSRAWLGWMPGGLAMVCLVASAFFTTFTGGSGITIVAIGVEIRPKLTVAGGRGACIRRWRVPGCRRLRRLWEMVGHVTVWTRHVQQ